MTDRIQTPPPSSGPRSGPAGRETPKDPGRDISADAEQFESLLDDPGDKRDDNRDDENSRQDGSGDQGSGQQDGSSAGQDQSSSGGQSDNQADQAALGAAPPTSAPAPPALGAAPPPAPAAPAPEPVAATPASPSVSPFMYQPVSSPTVEDTSQDDRQDVSGSDSDRDRSKSQDDKDKTRPDPAKQPDPALGDAMLRQLGTAPPTEAVTPKTMVETSGHMAKLIDEISSQVLVSQPALSGSRQIQIRLKTSILPDTVLNISRNFGQLSVQMVTSNQSSWSQLDGQAGNLESHLKERLGEDVTVEMTRAEASGGESGDQRRRSRTYQDVIDQADD